MEFSEFKNYVDNIIFKHFNLNVQSCYYEEKTNFFNKEKEDVFFKLILENSFVKIDISFNLNLESFQLIVSKDSTHFFTVSEYYKHKKSKLDIESLRSKSKEESWDDFLNRSFDFITSHFYSDIQNILLNTEWENINRDWHGLK